MAEAQRFTGRVALVTGAASGIGETTAKMFAAEGAAVVLLDIQEENTLRVEKEILDSGGRALAVVGDVRSDHECRRAVEAAVTSFGGLDIAFCNAGIFERGNVVDQTVEDWDVQIDTLLKGTFLTCKYAVPAMRERGGGSIVLSGSNCAHIGCAGRFAYTAAKAAMPVLAKQLSNDWFHGAHIRANCVSPGQVLTGMTTRTWREETGAPEGTPVPDAVAERWQRPEEIASTVLFLSSDEARDITGVTIPVSRTALLRVAGMRLR
ncbi:SDR family NAD(P)-dependent oxidoreductase [Streptomyces avermitilis]|uniref:SDR family NAD(P)-dependent oxidoreductase n=1 Tax=Streptomyces avermitilis TaxID=33903 RepID=UPI0033E5BF59